MRDLGPWDLEHRPRVWVLQEGTWHPGYLHAWYEPGRIELKDCGDGWVGYCSWSTAPGLQRILHLPAKWIRKQDGDPPAVPEGEVGFVPPQV